LRFFLVLSPEATGFLLSFFSAGAFAGAFPAVTGFFSAFGTNSFF